MIKLYSGTTEIYSHCCRFALNEKEIEFQIIDVDVLGNPEELALINPYMKVPVLVHRDAVLSEANIINEYIDERFPQIQLMSLDPVIRARVRMILYRIEKELFCHIDAIEHAQAKVADKARLTMLENLTSISGMLGKQKFILGAAFSMPDAVLAPLLWRLDHYGVKLGSDALPLVQYAERMFARPAFVKSMTSAEKAMRK